MGGGRSLADRVYHAAQRRGRAVTETSDRGILQHVLVRVLALAHLEQALLKAVEDGEARGDCEDAGHRMAGEPARQEARLCGARALRAGMIACTFRAGLQDR